MGENPTRSTLIALHYRSSRSFFPAVRIFLDRFVFEKAGRQLIFGKGMQVVQNESQQQQNKVHKFKESAWKCIYYLSAEILALAVTHDEPWFKNTKYFWLGPGNQTWPDQRYKLKLKALYMYAGGFYTYSIFALIFWETRQSDFGVSMGHHVATCILIIFSDVSRFSRVGSIVLAIHDASDVFLEVGRYLNTVVRKRLLAFHLFFLSGRRSYFVSFNPFWILWSTSYEVVQTLEKEKHKYIFHFLFSIACSSYRLVDFDVSDACQTSPSEGPNQ